MSRTPAAELARIKVNYPAWSIRRDDGDGSFTAKRKGHKTIRAPTLADLALALDRDAAGWGEK